MLMWIVTHVDVKQLVLVINVECTAKLALAQKVIERDARSHRDT